MNNSNLRRIRFEGVVSDDPETRIRETYLLDPRSVYVLHKIFDLGENWSFSVSDLVSRTKLTIYHAYLALRDLEAMGHFSRQKEYGGGRVITVYLFRARSNDPRYQTKILTRSA